MCLMYWACHLLAVNPSSRTTTLINMRRSHACSYTTSPASPEKRACSCFVATQHVRHQPGRVHLHTAGSTDRWNPEFVNTATKTALIIYYFDQQIHNMLTIMSVS
jgi:hypothetical protein